MVQKGILEDVIATSQTFCSTDNGRQSGNLGWDHNGALVEQPTEQLLPLYLLAAWHFGRELEAEEQGFVRIGLHLCVILSSLIHTTTFRVQWLLLPF